MTSVSGAFHSVSSSTPSTLIWERTEAQTQQCPRPHSPPDFSLCLLAPRARGDRLNTLCHPPSPHGLAQPLLSILPRVRTPLTKDCGAPAGGRQDGWHAPTPEAQAETGPTRPHRRAPNSAVSPPPPGQLWLLSLHTCVAAAQTPSPGCPALTSRSRQPRCLVPCPLGSRVGTTSGLTCAPHSPADSGGCGAGSGFLCARHTWGAALAPSKVNSPPGGRVAGTWGPAAPHSQVRALGMEQACRPGQCSQSW